VTFLTDQSKHNLDLAFRKAALATLPRNGDSCEIVPGNELSATPVAKLLVVTISSFSFRLMVIFRLEHSPAVRGYYVGEAAGTLDEVFAEVANLCCGMLSGELSHTFPHVGMSIPYQLNGSCFGYLSELNPQYLANFNIRINDSVQLHATLCMCCSDPVEVNFNAVEDETQRGDLELF